MISQEKLMILIPLQNLPNNVGGLGKIIVATGFEWLPKVQKITQSGHTDPQCSHKEAGSEAQDLLWWQKKIGK